MVDFARSNGQPIFFVNRVNLPYTTFVDEVTLLVPKPFLHLLHV